MSSWDRLQLHEALDRIQSALDHLKDVAAGKSCVVHNEDNGSSGEAKFVRRYAFALSKQVGTTQEGVGPHNRKHCEGHPEHTS